MRRNPTGCEFIGCDRDGWVVIHFGPNLTPPLRVACMIHKTVTELTMFWDAEAPPPPPPTDVECCASGRCEVCSPGYKW